MAEYNLVKIEELDPLTTPPDSNSLLVLAELDDDDYRSKKLSIHQLLSKVVTDDVKSTNLNVISETLKELDLNYDDLVNQTDVNALFATSIALTHNIAVTPSDWEVENPQDPRFIDNKPFIVSELGDLSDVDTTDAEVGQVIVRGDDGWNSQFLSPIPSSLNFLGFIDCSTEAPAQSAVPGDLYIQSSDTATSVIANNEWIGIVGREIDQNEYIVKGVDTRWKTGGSLATIMPQSNWAQKNSLRPDFIKNKPPIPRSINDLVDVDAKFASNGQVLVFNGEDWGYDDRVTDSDLSLEIAKAVQEVKEYTDQSLVILRNYSDDRDQYLTQKLQEETNLRAVSVELLTRALDKNATDIDGVSQRLEQEVLDRKFEDNVLRIDFEYADNELQGKINDERSARMLGDANVIDLVANEIKNREEEITRVDERISTERNNRMQGDLINSDLIANEIKTREEEDTETRRLLRIEELDRIDADNSLSTRITEEGAARRLGDLDNSDMILNEIKDREAAVEQEIDDRIAGDDDLQTQLDQEIVDRITGDNQIGGQLDALDIKVSEIDFELDNTTRLLSSLAESSYNDFIEINTRVTEVYDELSVKIAEVDFELDNTTRLVSSLADLTSGDITRIDQEIQAEVQLRAQTDQEIKDQLDTEISERKATDDTFALNLDNTDTELREYVDTTTETMEELLETEIRQEANERTEAIESAKEYTIAYSTEYTNHQTDLLKQELEEKISGCTGGLIFKGSYSDVVPLPDIITLNPGEFFICDEDVEGGITDPQLSRETNAGDIAIVTGSGWSIIDRADTTANSVSLKGKATQTMDGELRTLELTNDTSNEAVVTTKSFVDSKVQMLKDETDTKISAIPPSLPLSGGTLTNILYFNKGGKDYAQFSIRPNSGNDFATNIYSFGGGQMRFRTSRTDVDEGTGSHIILLPKASDDDEPQTKIYNVVDPTNGTMAVNRNYVDEKVATTLPLSGGTMTGPIEITGVSRLYAKDEDNETTFTIFPTGLVVGKNSIRSDRPNDTDLNFESRLNGENTFSVRASGKVTSKYLVTSGDDDEVLTTKKYVDDAIAESSDSEDYLPLAGGNMIGQLNTNSLIKSTRGSGGALEIRPSGGTVRGLWNTNGRIDITMSNKSSAAIRTFGSINVKSNSASDLDGGNNFSASKDYVRVVSEPSNENDVVNLKYLEGNYLPLAGGTMTGKLILNRIGNGTNGFTIKGEDGDGNDIDLLRVFHNNHNTADVPDAINYLGRQDGNENIVTNKWVKDQTYDMIKRYALAPARLKWKFSNTDSNAKPTDGYFKWHNHSSGEYLRVSFITQDGVDFGSQPLTDRIFRPDDKLQGSIWYYDSSQGDHKWKFKGFYEFGNFRWNYNNHLEFLISSYTGASHTSFTNGTEYYITIGGWF